MQKVRRHNSKLLLRPLVSVWFQVLFHSPYGVLFTFPSRYWFTIGHRQYLALRGGPRGFNPGFTCPDLLRNQRRSRSSFAYGTLTLYGRIFLIRSATRAICNSPAALRSDLALALQPRPRNARSLPRGIRFGLHPLALATTGGIETFFPFLRVLRCIISPGSLRAPYVFRCG